MQAERDDPSQARRRVVAVASAAGDERPGQYQRRRREVGPRETCQSGEYRLEARFRPCVGELTSTTFKNGGRMRPGFLTRQHTDKGIPQRSTCRHG